MSHGMRLKNMLLYLVVQPTDIMIQKFPVCGSLNFSCCWCLPSGYLMRYQAVGMLTVNLIFLKTISHWMTSLIWCQLIFVFQRVGQFTGVNIFFICKLQHGNSFGILAVFGSFGFFWGKFFFKKSRFLHSFWLSK